MNRRLLVILPAGLSLMAALDAGLVRLGWPLPLPQLDLPLAHGPLMVCGFLGTLIGLEKAVALGKRWAYVGPLATGAGGIGLIAFTHAAAPRLLFFAGSLVLVAVSASFFRRHRDLANGCVVTGAALWASGNGLWLSGWPLFAVVPFWIGFLLLIISGERLELNRLMSPSLESRLAFGASVGAALIGIALASVGFSADESARVVFTERGDVYASPGVAWGVQLLGIALAAMGLWLSKNDMARVALKRPGLTRFMAVSLLLGYGWLVASGVLWLVHGAVVGGVVYDAVLHAFFLGFAFSMIFAHGPVIFPAILGRRLDFHPAFYGHVALLHAGLVVRLVGDFTELWSARPWGGLLNAVAILLFIGNTAFAAVRGSVAASPESA